MSEFIVVDAMAIILCLEKRKLPEKIKNIFQQAEAGNSSLFISTISVAELGYLAEKNRIETNFEELEAYCKKYPSIQIIPLTQEIIYKSFKITDIPELHDRLIAGTAYLTHSKIITNDPKITASKYVQVIWE